MKLVLKTRGGFANLLIEGEIDTDELPAELAGRIVGGLDSEALRDAAPGRNPQLADGTLYELTILPESEDDELRHFLIDDAAVEDEILEILDEILHEIIRRKRAAAGTPQAGPAG